MNSKYLKPSLLKKSIAASVLLLACGAAGVASAQVVNLRAEAQSTTLPDGQNVPMWGYVCSDGGSGGATCGTAKDPTVNLSTGQAITSWAPPVIRVPAGPLTINLVNHLKFTGYSAPTSIVIVGQVGGGLGTNRTYFPASSFHHEPQGTTWPGTLGGVDPGSCSDPDPMAPGNAGTFCPPPQGQRIRSMATEVPAVTDNTAVALSWNLRPGTYLIESGTEPSIQGAMGLYGLLVVTDPAAPANSEFGTAYDTDVPLLLSEIDPVQNSEVNAVARNPGFTDDSTVWNGQPGKCGDINAPPASHTCFPPAVNYSPAYYLVNGTSFDRTVANNPGASSSLNVLPAGAGANGRVLLRFVNAGLHMHVPAVVGARMTLVAEDGNPVKGTRVQNEVFLSAGKTFDVTIAPKQSVAGTYDGATLPVFDRALSLSASNQHDGGMQAYLNVAGGAASGVGSAASAVALSASDKSYYCIAGSRLNVSDPSKGLLGGSTGANGVTLTGVTGAVTTAALSVNADGTFSYAAPAGSCAGTFTYNVNGSAVHTATIQQCDSSVQDGACSLVKPVAGPITFKSDVASRYDSKPPGVLAGVTSSNTDNTKLSALTAGTVPINSDGSFTATLANTAAASCAAAGLTVGPTGDVPTGTVCRSFQYQVQNAQGTQSDSPGTAYVAFKPASGLVVNLIDAVNKAQVTKDYRWIIEEDRTFWIDPKCQVNNPTGPRLDSRGQACPPLPVESLAYNFHTSFMPVVAGGCVGPTSCESGQTRGGTPVACDVGNGVCQDSYAQKIALDPADVYLDPNKRYFISVLPGDGVNTTIGGAGGAMPVDSNCNPDIDSCQMRAFDIAKDCGPYNPADPRWIPGADTGLCGHEMGGAQIAPAPLVGSRPAVNIPLQELPLPTGKLAIFVFEDDFPLNGENDAGGGVDVLAPNEPGLGGFEVKIFDQAGMLGDNTGQPTYDEFNQPLTNSLAGYIDPQTGLDACPITVRQDDPNHNFVGMIPTCPTFESDGKTLSPLAGQVTIPNLYAGFYEVQAYPAADRIARGEQWLQTNTLDGTPPHEVFIKPNEPGYFQEFGPGAWHVTIGFANPQIINDRREKYCASALNNLGPCNHTLKVHVTNNHMSRVPDERTFSSGSYDHYSFTTCYVSIGPPEAEDFAIGACDADGTVTFNNMPNGTFKIAVFDQWNDIILDGLVGSITINGDTDKEWPVTQWRSDISTFTYIDNNRDGLPEEGEPGLALVNTNIRYRDGSIGFFNNTDLAGAAGFNEVFPFMNWLVVETTSTRFKPEATHTVYDAGGAVDGTTGGGSSSIGDHLANTLERPNTSLPDALRLPGGIYCADADCSARVNVPLALSGPVGPASGLSSGAIVRPEPWGNTQGWQGLLGQDNFIEFAMRPFGEGENGGIQGHVIYASTRPFDDPTLLLQLSWEPGVPHVKLNLYSKTVDESGNEHLTLVDTTTTTSWDDWAQGFHFAADGVTKIPNMNCPGQDPTSPFFQTLKDSKQWLDPSNPKTPLPNNSQFKCFDGWSQLNAVQPAPYDGMYSFPSVTKTDPVTGKAAGTNCTACVPNPDSTDPFRFGTPMLPKGTYVVEVVVPPGYELVKEEDKNILLGDVYIAPVTQQFLGFGNIYIMPDQAAVSSHYNASNPGNLDLTTDLGAQPRHEGDTGSIESFWPCVGAERVVPDLNSLFPGAGQAAPFAGATRRLCDRKEVVLTDQATVLAKFYVFSSTHIAAHLTGMITNDYASEFDPFSPQFGEKFSPPNLPVALRDFNGNEVARVYGDQWGAYNGLFYSSWSVNPPNPTGYAPQMSIACMNDPGPIPDPVTGAPITDPAYNAAYSDFCYEWSFMPGLTSYMDTPVIPTQSFADGYNLPDTEYPDATPAIATVVNSNASVVQGPWVSTGAGGTAPTVQFSITAVQVNDQITSITAATTPVSPNLLSGTLRCGSGLLILTCNNVVSQTTRNNTMAVAVATSINLRTGVTGYAASVSGNTVTITAPLSPPVSNGTLITVAQTGITITGVPTLAFAGGTSGPPVAMGLNITALGDKVVQNPNFSGPNSTTAPFNSKTITRHYGFGSRPATCPTSGNCPNVTVGGVPMTNVATWTDALISGTVNATGVANCTVQQRNTPSTAKCGELVITAANGKQSIDTVTVTIDGSQPWVVTPTSVTAPSGKSVKNYATNFGRMAVTGLPTGAVNSPIQVAIDSATAGDLIIVQPGTYRENVLMWKPLRVQGVGAASVTVNADAHPAGKMDQWRRQVNCIFGLTLDGVPNPNNAHYRGNDPSNLDYSCPNEMFMRGDRIPFEALIGWDAAGNGNLAQYLQEPTLMGAYEGAGFTVVGRGVRAPACTGTFAANCNDLWGANATGGPGAFTDGSVYLGSGNTDCTPTAGVDGKDYGSSNFKCNPSRIDGLSIINSSQGGGGIFIHGWSHNLEVSNTRMSGNQGTLAGAINLGNGETPDAFVNDGVECGTALTGANAVMPCPPIPYNSTNGSSYGSITNSVIPFQWNTKVHIHHNMLANNASIGDALFSGTPAGSGAITISAGADDYVIDHNWIAGNMSIGDGGGMQHLGLSFNGNISHNYILFNQTTNPTLPTNGGGLILEGANLDRSLSGQECGSINDQDCPPGLTEGAGYSLVVDGNLILGNSADSGSGGGVRIQQINGTEVLAFPTGPDPHGSPNATPGWFDVTVTNNIIVNNVAGWDGGGVSMQDALKVTFINNTVASNDTTASAGTLFKTLGAVTAASPPPGCDAQTDPSLPQDPSCTGSSAAHGPQPAGLVVMENTPNLISAVNDLGGGTSGAIRCPVNFGYTSNTVSPTSNRNDCRRLSKPRMANDLFWQNRYFSVDIIGVGSGNQSAQNLVALSPQLSQTATGMCSANNNYWDIGLRTDDVASGAISRLNNSLTLTNSIYSANNSVGDATGSSLNPVTSTGNIVGGATPVVAPYCNGARVPPENCAGVTGLTQQASCRGYNTPVGASETTGQNPLFTFNGIQTTATIDEGQNWLNLVFGPLTLSRPNAANSNAEMMIASRVLGTAQGAYSIPASSSAINHGTNGTTGTNTALPATTVSDFFGNARARSVSNPADIGAVEYGSSGSSTGATVAPSSLGFGNQPVGQASAPQTLTLTAGSTAMTGISVTGIAAPFSRPAGAAGGTCVATLAANSSCTINIVFTPSATGAASGSVTVSATTGGPVTGSPVPLSGNGGAAVNLTVTPNTLLQFGNVYVGQSSTAQAVTLTNTGAVPVTGIGLAGLGGVFNDAGGGTCTAGLLASLPVAGSCTVNVRFTPTANAPVNGSLTVTAASGLTISGSPVQFAGNGLQPTIGPSPVDFGTVPVGTQVRMTVTVDNSKNVNSNPAFPITTLALTAPYTRPGGSAGGTCPAAGGSVPANSTCTIVVQFLQAVGSSATGTTNGTLTLTSTGGPALPVVNLTANSIPATYHVTVTPDPLAFGNQAVNATSAAKSLTVTNTGNSPIAGMTVSGITAPYARVNGGCGSTLAVGASCTISIRFTPTALGAAPARTVTVGGAGLQSPNPAVTASLTGSGVAATVAFTAASTGTLSGGTLAFGNPAGNVFSIVTVKNNGASAVTFGTATVSGNRFSRGADTCSGITVGAGATCTIRVNFNGTGTTPRTGTLTVVDSTGAQPVVPLNLTGS